MTCNSTVLSSSFMRSAQRSEIVEKYNVRQLRWKPLQSEDILDLQLLVASLGCPCCLLSLVKTQQAPPTYEVQMFADTTMMISICLHETCGTRSR